MTIATETATDSLTTLRSTIYRLILVGLDRPSDDRHRLLRDPSYRESLELLGGHFDLPIPEDEFVPEEFPDYESRYLATFEVGVPEAPVVLLASHHSKNEPAPRVVHEHILFYKHFDAAPMNETGEAADHLLNGLRFLIHLDEIHESNPDSRDAVQRARADFLDRQLLRWVPAACARADDNGVPVFYRALLDLLAAVLREDRQLIPIPIATPKPRSAGTSS